MSFSWKLMTYRIDILSKLLNSPKGRKSRCGQICLESNYRNALKLYTPIIGFNHIPKLLPGLAYFTFHGNRVIELRYVCLSNLMIKCYCVLALNWKVTQKFFLAGSPSPFLFASISRSIQHKAIKRQNSKSGKAN